MPADEREDRELKTVKFQMMLTPSETKAIDDWMFNNRFRSRAEAIRRLCQIAIEIEQPVAHSALAALALSQSVRQANTSFQETLTEKGLSGEKLNAEAIKYMSFASKSAAQVLQEAGKVFAIFNAFRRKGDLREILAKSSKASADLKKIAFGDTSDPAFNEIFKDVFSVGKASEQPDGE